MKQLSIMLKSASSLCNLRCKYCFYADVADVRQVRSFGIMSPETTRAILKNIRSLLEPGDAVTFAFQGGEPTLAGLEYFERFTGIVDSWKDIRVSYAIQTNGMLLDDQWCDFLKKYNFLVGISWDLLPDCHDSVRVDARGEGTARRVLEAVALLERRGLEYNVLCTLTNFVARHPGRVWKQLKKYNIRYVQFTPCLDELERPGESIYALTPERFASFYRQLFTLWYADLRAGNYRSVKLFDDIVNLLAYGTPTACGMDGHCRPQIVVEADGSVYPCDFYCVDDYRLGNLTQCDLGQIFASPQMAAFALRAHEKPGLCGSCEFARFCGGYCKRMQRQVCCAPGEDFCGYRQLLREHGEAFGQIAAWQRSLRGRKG